MKGVGVILCLAACAPVTPREPMGMRVRDTPSDNDLVAIIPADAEAVLALDMAQLRRSGWTRDLVMAERPADRAVRGFDEANDVDRLVFARLASTGEQASLSVAQGRFDRAKVIDAFRRRAQGARSSSVRGCAMWAKGEEALAFLTDRTLLSGPVSAVRGAIEASLGRAPSARDQAWLEELETALAERSGRPPAVAVAVLVTDAVRARLQREIAEVESLDRLAARLDLGETLDIGAVGVARGRREASGLASQLGSMLHSLRTRASLTVLGLLPVLEGTRVVAQGARVLGELHLSEGQREQIALRLAMAAKFLAERKPHE